MAEKEYDNEMRGTLFEETQRTNDKSPIATGTVTISGVELRVAMWPARTAAPNTKAAGKKFWSLSVEYKQGTKRFLILCSPSDVKATGATVTVDTPSKDLPF